MIIYRGHVIFTGKSQLQYTADILSASLYSPILLISPGVIEERKGKVTLVNFKGEGDFHLASLYKTASIVVLPAVVLHAFDLVALM